MCSRRFVLCYSGMFAKRTFIFVQPYYKLHAKPANRKGIFVTTQQVLSKRKARCESAGVLMIVRLKKIRIHILEVILQMLHRMLRMLPLRQLKISASLLPLKVMSKIYMIIQFKSQLCQVHILPRKLSCPKKSRQGWRRKPDPAMLKSSRADESLWK